MLPKKENERLKLQIEALKTDSEEIERVAREELGMIKPDEVLYCFEEGGDSQPAETGSDP